MKADDKIRYKKKYTFFFSHGLQINSKMIMKFIQIDKKNNLWVL